MARDYSTGFSHALRRHRRPQVAYYTERSKSSRRQKVFCQSRTKRFVGKDCGKDCSKGGKGHGEGVGTDVKGGRSRRVRVMRKRRREKEIREGRGVTGEKLAGKPRKGTASSRALPGCLRGRSRMQDAKIQPWARRRASTRSRKPGTNRLVAESQKPEARS
jgi:hypothetical protein